jgi:phosphonate transport system substrate-binding protein
MSNSEPTPIPTPPSGGTFSLKNVFLLVIPLSLIIGAVGGWLYFNADAEQKKKVSVGASLKSSMDVPTKLTAGFEDEDKDMVADPPKDASKQLDPAELVFSTLGSDEEKETAIWKDFFVHLKKKTGKDAKLVLGTFINKEQLETLTEGKIHIVQLSTGNVSSAVNVGGVVPFAVMADGEGKFGYQMEMIVPAKSTATSLKDLRGKTIALMNFRSHAGFKLPLVQLWSELQMLPERDYDWVYAGRYEPALEKIRKGTVDAAPIAGDFLKREIAKPEKERAIAEGEYKTIFTSKTFPPACFGHLNQLKPDLAEKIRDAFFTFEWKGTSLEKGYQAANQSKFVKISYKDDWAAVREVDELMMKFVQVTP